MIREHTERLISVRTNGIVLEGMLGAPHAVLGTILFAHGSSRSRFSPRNNFVAKVLRHYHLVTLPIDLLTPGEDEIYKNRFDIELLTELLVRVAQWVQAASELSDLPLGLFGASTGAASALRLAASMGEKFTRSCREAAGRIWQRSLCPLSPRQRSSSSVETMIWYSN